MSLNSTKNCSVPELLNNFKIFLLLAVFAVSSINIFAQTSSPSSCSDFESATAQQWPKVIPAAAMSDGVLSQEEQTISINLTSVPAGAKWRVFKTTEIGQNDWEGAVDLVLGANHLTVPAVDWADTLSRAVKFQFNVAALDIEFDALVLNGVYLTGCVPFPSTSTIDFCGEFESSSSNWASHIYAAVTPDDGVLSQAAQTLSINVTSLPDTEVNWRFFRTTQNGSDNHGGAQTMTLGLNTITVPAVTFDRTVKFQFSDGGVVFDALNYNGVNSNCVTAPAAGTALSDCEILDFTNLNWPAILTACVAGDGNNGAQQQLIINVTSLPEGGATARVNKTT
ncbi:MAG: hypothetical protein CMP64_00365, partial [Flavobacteriales bacterium]|nr:hypothetical protein [Flavobacteriales bacterium]